MPKADPGSLPGRPGFATTAWSIVRGAQAVSASQRARALGQLIAVYWRPVYWQFRTDWNANAEDARDLTQEYFATFLEKGLIDDVAKEKGRFRAYVKATVKNFMLMKKRAKKAIKRGGKVKIEPLDDLKRVEEEARGVEESPEKRFERDLMRSIFREAMERLETECATAGKSKAFGAFQAYYVEEQEGKAPAYEDLEKRFGLKGHELKNGLHALRGRFREIVMEFLKDGTTSEEELVAEAQELFES